MSGSGSECRFKPAGADNEYRTLTGTGLWAGTQSLLGVVRSEGTRTPTILLTATSRQRVYQFRHERLESATGDGSCAAGRIDGADVTNRGWRDKAC